MTAANYNKSVTMGQDGGEGSIPEQTVVISTDSEAMYIRQGKDSINLNYESLNEFIKNLKNAAKNR